MFDQFGDGATVQGGVGTLTRALAFSCFGFGDISIFRPAAAMVQDKIIPDQV